MRRRHTPTHGTSRRRPLRTAARLAVAVTAVLALSGCAISAYPRGDADGKTVLTFWQYYQGPQLDWLQDQADRFEQSHPDVRVELVPVVGSQQDQKLLASVATGTGPDLFINNIVVDYPTLTSAGVMKDLTPYWDAFPDRGQFPAATLWKTGSKIYNVLPYTNLVGMYYNRDALAASGISSPPTTLDELQADMAKVAADGKYKPLAMSGAPTVEGAWLFAPQLLGLGVDYCNLSGSKVSAAFDRIADWHRKDYTPQATATWDQNAAWQQFMTGKYAFAFNGNWQLGNVKQASFRWGTAEYPAPSGGKSSVYPGGEGFAVGADSKHPKLAWDFIQQTILSEQGQKQVFTKAGSIPFRSDAARSDAISGDRNVTPFVDATKTTGTWPDNENTADMQTALGTAVSGVLSGQLSAAAGARQAEQQIHELIEQGGGSCA